jgi:hypothetical protein
MPDGGVFFPLVALASTDRAARRRAIGPVSVTMLPGAPAQKAALDALVVTQEVENGFRRERRVANQMVGAVGAAMDHPETFDRDELTQFPALRPLATDALVASIKGIPAPAQAVDQKVVEQAVAAIKAAIALPKNGKLAKADRTATKFRALTSLMSDAQKDELFNK